MFILSVFLSFITVTTVTLSAVRFSDVLQSRPSSFVQGPCMASNCLLVGLADQFSLRCRYVVRTWAPKWACPTSCPAVGFTALGHELWVSGTTSFLILQTP